MAEEARAKWRSGQNTKAFEKSRMDFGNRKSHAERGCHFRTNKQLNIHAEVAELADALDSGSSGSNTVWVQVPSPAPKIPNASALGIFPCVLGMRNNLAVKVRYRLGSRNC